MIDDPTTTAMQLMATRIVRLERRCRRLENGVQVVTAVLDAYTRFNHRAGSIIEGTCDLDAIEAYTQAVDDLRSVISEVVPR